jgi:fucose 4-O-acetylase-like acetyltransferase
MTSPASPTAGRHAWVDVAKGMGIILVVLGHAIMGVHDAGKLAADSLWMPLNSAIYSFHMPLFFVLSGIFASARLVRPARPFVLGMARQIVWPYLLWALVQTLVISAAGSVVNRPGKFDAATLPSLLYLPPSQFWFLYVLVMCFVASYLLARMHINASSVLVLALAAYCMHPQLSVPYVVAKFMAMYVYFAAGITARSMLLATVQTPRRLPAVGAATLALAMCAAWWAPTGSVGQVLTTLAVAVAGSAFTMALAQSVGSRATNCLALLGRESLNLYLLHIFFVAGTRIALFASYPDVDTGLAIVLACAAGLIGPLIAARVFSRLGVASAIGMVPVRRSQHVGYQT